VQEEKAKQFAATVASLNVNAPNPDGNGNGIGDLTTDLSSVFTGTIKDFKMKNRVGLRVFLHKIGRTRMGTVTRYHRSHKKWEVDWDETNNVQNLFNPGELKTDQVSIFPEVLVANPNDRRGKEIWVYDFEKGDIEKEEDRILVCVSQTDAEAKTGCASSNIKRACIGKGGSSRGTNPPRNKPTEEHRG